MKTNSLEEYLSKRKDLITSAEKNKFGDLTFSEDEEKANECFKKKLIALRESLPSSFYREYTLKYVDLIQKSDIFSLLQIMPKGGVLHLHMSCCFEISWLISKCMSPNCYKNLSTGKLLYRKKDPGNGFKQMIKLREEAENKTKFDEDLRNSLQLTLRDVQESKDVWDTFEEKIMRMNEFLFFEELYYEHILVLARGFIREGVFHLEVREFLNVLLNENGDLIGPEQEMLLYQKAIDEIKKECPHFTLKLIIQGLKIQSFEEIEKNLRMTLKTAKKFPHLIVGYDLVMEEDKFKQMKELAEVLIKKEQIEAEIGIQLPYVFHGGESLKYLENDNLFDLILLKTKRIGHGLNLAKHSYLMDKFKEKNVAIEINPLSNQILDYIYDLRLHPGITFHNYGLKITINSDDPGIFNSNYINYDFFICAVSMEFDLKDFKKICNNSLECSLLNEEEKNIAKEIWEKQWENYIKRIN